MARKNIVYLKAITKFVDIYINGYANKLQITVDAIAFDISDLQNKLITSYNFYQKHIKLFDGSIGKFGKNYPNTVIGISEKVKSFLGSYRRIYQQSNYSPYQYIKDFGIIAKDSYAGNYNRPKVKSQWYTLITSNYPKFNNSEYIKISQNLIDNNITVSYKAYVGYFLKIKENMDFIQQLSAKNFRIFCLNLFNKCIKLLNDLAKYYQVNNFSDSLFNGKYTDIKRIAFQLKIDNNFFQTSWFDNNFSQFLDYMLKFLEGKVVVKNYKTKQITEVPKKDFYKESERVWFYIRPITPMIDNKYFSLRKNQYGLRENRKSNYIYYR